MTTKPTNADDGGATAKRKSIKVQFWYDDGTTEWVEGKEYEKWQQGVNGAIQNDYIHGAWSQPILTSIKWEKSPTKLNAEASRPAQDIVAEAKLAKVKNIVKHHKGCVDPESQFIVEGECNIIEELEAVLSPTKNTAPTEAEESRSITGNISPRPNQKDRRG